MLKWNYEINMWLSFHCEIKLTSLKPNLCKFLKLVLHLITYSKKITTLGIGHFSINDFYKTGLQF